MSDTIEEFRQNPVGFVVQLHDGRQREVKGFEDTPRGRWLCLGRRWGPWVPECDVASLVTFSLTLKEKR